MNEMMGYEAKVKFFSNLLKILYKAGKPFSEIMS